jgi:hypothetical protein
MALGGMALGGMALRGMGVMTGPRGLTAEAKARRAGFHHPGAPVGEARGMNEAAGAVGHAIDAAAGPRVEGRHRG